MRTKKNSDELWLPLKRQWYEMIDSGEKLEEYREITDYWEKRLTDKGVIKRFKRVHFTLGYPKKEDSSRHMVFSIKDITIGNGNPKWGAEKGKNYFVIKIGKRL